MLKNNSLKNLIGYIWKYSPNRRLFLTYVSLSVMARLVALTQPLIVGWIFNSAQFSASDPKMLQHVIFGLALLAVNKLVVWAFHGPSRVMEKKHAFLVRKKFRQEMFDRVLTFPAKWHKDNHSGDTIDKIKKAATSLYDFSFSSYAFIDIIVSMAGSVILLAIFDWRSIIIAIPAAVLAVFTVVHYDRDLRIKYRKIFRAENFLAAGIHDYVSNILTVITLRLRKTASKEVGVRARKPFKVFNKTNKLEEWKWFLVGTYISFATAGILIVNAYFSYKTAGMILIGNLVILYQYLSRIGEILYSLAWRLGQVVHQDAALREAQHFFDVKVSTQAKVTAQLPPGWQTLQIKKLWFDYDDGNNKESVLKFKGGNIKGVSFVIKRKQKIALIGESGSGKSTIFSLIRGLHNPDKVEIFCDGKKLESGMTHLNDYALLIPQEPELFNDTVSANIAMGNKVSEQEITKALKIARFASVVRRLEKGLQTNVLEKGVSLSGGEKQRLALARGLLVAKDYDFILLDEPTSSVDSENELAIYQDIFERFSDKTILSAVHRLHLLRYFDYVYYFRGGKIITEGTFSELLHDEDFKKLWEIYNKEESLD